MQKHWIFLVALRISQRAHVPRRISRLHDDRPMAKSRIDTSGEANPLSNNPFANLDVPASNRSPDAVSDVPSPSISRRKKQTSNKRGRVDVIRQTAGRGGKTVTVLTGFKGIAGTELQELARDLQRTCGVGGTVKPGTIEIQGDQRDRACTALEAAGFRPVRAGG